MSRTAKVPAEANVWDGFRVALVAPSPKSHDHDVGEPVEASSSNGDVAFY